VLSDSYFNTTAIKCTFNPLTRFAVVANEVRGCVETMAVVFYHTHLAMLLLLSRNKGRLVLREKTINDNEMLNMWNTMARVMYRCLHGQGQYGTTNADMYEHCRDYCVEFDLFGSLPERQIGWYGKVLDELAKRSATIHKTHLDTNLHIYAQRYIHVLIATDDRFETINGLKTVDLNKVVSAVTYGDDEKTQKETVQTIIARRPSTRAEYDKACKSIAEAEKIGNQAALLKAEAKKAEALRPEHEAWAEAEVLRAVVAQARRQRHVFRKERALLYHTGALPGARTDSPSAGPSGRRGRCREQEASGSQEEEEEVGVRIVSRPGLCAPTRPDQFDGREGTVRACGEGSLPH